MGPAVLEENSSFWAILLSFLFVRVVDLKSPFKSRFVVVGVPPWRQLVPNDISTKRTFRLKF